MTNEELSEWLDGEKEEAVAGWVVKELSRQAGLRETCCTYWLIGDCLRDGAAGLDVHARVMDALEDEPAILAPQAVRPTTRASRLMPVAAAAAGLAVAAWMGLGLWSGPDKQAGLVANNTSPPATALAAQDTAGSGGDERAYLMAHQASMVGAPMAGVAQYIRTVGAGSAGENR